MFTITMHLQRSTKNTDVYVCAEPGARIQTLYIMKQGERPPEKIQVAVHDDNT